MLGLSSNIPLCLHFYKQSLCYLHMEWTSHNTYAAISIFHNQFLFVYRENKRKIARGFFFDHLPQWKQEGPWTLEPHHTWTQCFEQTIRYHLRFQCKQKLEHYFWSHPSEYHWLSIFVGKSDSSEDCNWSDRESECDTLFCTSPGYLWNLK